MLRYMETKVSAILWSSVGPPSVQGEGVGSLGSSVGPPSVQGEGVGSLGSNVGPPSVQGEGVGSLVAQGGLVEEEWMSGALWLLAVLDTFSLDFQPLSSLAHWE